MLGVDYEFPRAVRQIDLLVKRVHPGGRLLIVEQCKIALLQVGKCNAHACRSQ